MSLKFIDLFAGIGGTRLAFEKAGMQCAFSSEKDKFSRITYEANHHDVPEGDITAVEKQRIPDHDVLVAGFPCQPFSLAGVSKQNSLGRPHGFLHETQGTMFFQIADILEKKRPQSFMLENVKNLQTHDRGKTFKTIINSLRELDYEVGYRVIDGAKFVPQHRERTYIIGFHRDLVASPNSVHDPRFWPESPSRTVKTLQEILVNDPDPKYILSDSLWEYLQQYSAKHRANGNGFGFGLVNPADPSVKTRTLSARYHKDGSEILISRDQSGETENPRKLTPRECARLMGFEDSFEIPVSDTQAYRQFGNSVIVPLVTELAFRISLVLTEKGFDQISSSETQSLLL